jgi:hypothetical protein
MNRTIPKKIFIALRGYTNFQQDYTGAIFQVRPAFIVSARSEKLTQSATKWASHLRNSAPTYLELDNDPISSLHLLGTEIRQDNLTAKIVTLQGWLVDLRSDEFLESVFTGKLNNQIISDDFVWSQCGSQMRLIRVNGKLFNNVLPSHRFI